MRLGFHPTFQHQTPRFQGKPSSVTQPGASEPASDKDIPSYVLRCINEPLIENSDFDINTVKYSPPGMCHIKAADARTSALLRLPELWYKVFAAPNAGLDNDELMELYTLQDQLFKKGYEADVYYCYLKAVSLTQKDGFTPEQSKRFKYLEEHATNKATLDGVLNSLVRKKAHAMGAII